MQKQEIIKECLNRMKKLGLIKECINAFKEHRQVMKSEFKGILYELDSGELEFVKNFEDTHNCIVYHIIKSYTDFGTILNLLYVDEHKEEWEYFNEDLKCGLTFVYAENLDDEYCSEFGSIGIRAINGGLVRVE